MSLICFRPEDSGVARAIETQASAERNPRIVLSSFIIVRKIWKPVKPVPHQRRPNYEQPNDGNLSGSQTCLSVIVASDHCREALVDLTATLSSFLGADEQPPGTTPLAFRPTDHRSGAGFHFHWASVTPSTAARNSARDCSSHGSAFARS